VEEVWRSGWWRRVRSGWWRRVKRKDEEEGEEEGWCGVRVEREMEAPVAHLLSAGRGFRQHAEESPYCRCTATVGTTPAVAAN
jgi:hypothetical protein